jgi:outer membrane biosynthesis protein TonB
VRFDRITSRLSDVLSKMSGPPRLSGLTLPSPFSANGGIPIVYKGIVVTVMAIVASGTLVTFGTAGAEEVPMARSGAQIPAASEANPVVEGQPLPAGLDPSIFASSPLLSAIDLTGASAADFSSFDDDDDSGNKNKNKNKKNKNKKKPATKKPVTKKPAAKKPAADETKKQAATSNPAPNPAPSEKASDKPAEQQTTQPPPAPEPTPTEQAPTKRECIKREPLTRLCLKWSS